MLHLLNTCNAMQIQCTFILIVCCIIHIYTYFKLLPLITFYQTVVIATFPSGSYTNIDFLRAISSYIVLVFNFNAIIEISLCRKCQCWYMYNVALFSASPSHAYANFVGEKSSSKVFALNVTGRPWERAYVLCSCMNEDGVHVFVK